MAQIDRFYIGQLDGKGLQTDLKPYAIPDNAFTDLNNAYVFRGRVRKRFGAQLMRASSTNAGFEQIQSRLKINIGTTDGSGDFSDTVPGAIFAVGQAFSIGSNFFTVTQTGTPANLLVTGTGTGTYDTSNGAVTITASDLTADVYFYPSTPVMGLPTYQKAEVNVEDVIAFDQQFAYIYDTNGWEQLGTAIWTGDNSQFFWGTNWRGISSADIYFFVTNFEPADGIRYWDGSTWNTLKPVINSTTQLSTARIVLPFKDRLIALNTIEESDGIQFSAPNTTDGSGNFNQTVAGAYAIGEQFVVGNTIFQIASAVAGLQNMTVFPYPGIKNPPTAQFNFASGNLVITGNNNNVNLPVYYFDSGSTGTASYVNRCRFSLNGNPVLANGWLESPGLGGYIDAPTKEAIVTAQFLKDRLIVYFESSTWELVYTGNQVLPFVWQQINTEFGAESTFSQIPFDKAVLGVGNVGIQACNGSNVERIDEQIPDEVFKVHNDNGGVKRVAGIRDYYTEMVYWSFPSETRNSDFPFNDKVLTYNYKNGAWAFNDDSITAFGYFQSVIGGISTDLIWSDADIEWKEGDFPWNSPTIQAKFRNIIAGNQQGFVFKVIPDKSSNCESLQITDVDISLQPVITVSCINHNLDADEYIKFDHVYGITGLDGIIGRVLFSPSTNSFSVRLPSGTVVSGSYTGGGTLTRVTPINFKTKQYNFYANQGRNAYVSKVDFLVDRTDDGQCVVDFMVSSSDDGMVQQSAVTGSLVGSSILETSPYTLVPYEQQQDRLWHPVYFQADGETIQLHFYLNDAQTRDAEISEEDFELHAMTIYSTPTSSRLQ